ncbi:hypothetical protein T4B_8663 [Trichinella pseudospiralis]|uniref:Uncharacterized protein n=1 Tax=Trichinella pseudospiralis TaxID=6337 RepID=A0A0V1J645_TRIPS|nr:hypothetical protein T4B_8663 [Trichinella pseudospiralis]KRZ30443.1 hypothetical protein T4C_10746 [Trichinella pseudospiralis]
MINDEELAFVAQSHTTQCAFDGFEAFSTTGNLVVKMTHSFTHSRNTFILYVLLLQLITITL